MLDHENPRMFLSLLPTDAVVLREGEHCKIVTEIITADCGKVVVMEHHLMDLVQLREWTNTEEYLNDDNVFVKNVFFGANKDLRFSWILDSQNCPHWKLEVAKYHLSLWELLQTLPKLPTQVQMQKQCRSGAGAGAGGEGRKTRSPFAGY